MKQRLIDRATFRVTAGKGGDGSIHFRREKYVPKGGPDGGDGGRGGSIILRANRHSVTLRFFSGRDRFEADNGRPGGKRQRTGDDAPDKVLEVPVGTIVLIKKEGFRLLRGRSLYGDDVERLVSSGYKVDRVEHLDFEERWEVNPKFKTQSSKPEEEWVEVADLSTDGEEIVIAMGGRGGLGNETYKSSRNTTPRVAQRGEMGEEYWVRLELKVLADVGLVGLPNVGKSTLLSVLTKARPEIAGYPFTTLSPNLGVLESRIMNHESRGIVIADIPGLIEDAHKGKGLGVDFLRHVERCRALVYVLAPMEEDLMETTKSEVRNPKQNDKFQITNDNKDVSDGLAKRLWEQYETVRHEVESYGHGLSEKPVMVVVNKIDLIQDLGIMIQEYFKKKGVEAVMVSAATTEGIEELREKLVKLMNWHF